MLEVLDTDSASRTGADVLPEQIRVDRSSEVVRYYCDDTEALKDLASSYLKTENYLIRQTNLEDVFLRATGRQLNDRQ